MNFNSGINNNRILFVFISLISVGLGQQCRSFNRQLGNCVSIKTCPPLLQILKGSPTQDQLRQLQKLTCGFDNTDPKVCCPLKDILQVNPPPPNVDPSPVSPTNPDVSSRINQSTETSKPTETSETDLSSHPGFKEIPLVKDCGTGLGQERIIGGKNVSHGAYPWMVRIGYKNAEGTKVDYFCGGTVISKRYVLTAAHCTEGTGEYLPVEVRLGEHDTLSEMDCNNELQQCSEAQDYKIQKVTSHPNYSPNTKQNDISLIRLEQDVDFSTYFIKPVCLPFFKEYKTEGQETPDKGIVAGWGRTHWNKAEGSTILQEVTLPVKTNEECQTIYNRRVMISPKQLCAGGVSGMDSCGGDSGGPLLVPLPVNKSPRMFQLGVVSFGPVQCGVGGLPGVYTRTSSYLPWILDIMAEQSH